MWVVHGFVPFLVCFEGEWAVASMDGFAVGWIDSAEGLTCGRDGWVHMGCRVVDGLL